MNLARVQTVSPTPPMTDATVDAPFHEGPAESYPRSP